MFQHFLVPLDGSNLAEAIMPAAHALAARLQARITLLHIVEQHAPATIHGDTHLGDTAAADKYLGALAERWSHEGVCVDSHVHSEQPQNVAKMIVDQAAELDADLIVLCTHGRGALREKLLGSIAQQVVHEGRVPVLLLRPAVEDARAPRAIHNIVLPLDGEPVHETAIPIAAALAARLGATIHLLSVVPTMETMTGDESASGAVLPNAMRAVLDFAQQGGVDYLRGVRAKIVTPTTAEVARGDPARSIVSTAKRVDADLIVMATHGRMGLSAFWSASVAPKVLNEFAGPLLLLRAAEQ